MNNETLAQLNRELEKEYGMVKGYPRAVVVRLKNKPNSIRIIENKPQKESAASEQLYDAVCAKCDKANGKDIAWTQFDPNTFVDRPVRAGEVL